MPHPPLIVVQARAGSTRLPGKVLAELGGMPMLTFQLRRLLPIVEQTKAALVVATSDRPGDDEVAATASDLGVPTVRGSEADVLDRFISAMDQHPSDTVVRLTADCPLADPRLVAEVIDLHHRCHADYTSNVLPRSYPKGMDVEVVSARALRDAAGEATNPSDREHVTPFVYRRPERFRLANLSSGDNLGQEWWTVDTGADLERLREMVAALADPLTMPWREVLSVVGRTQGPRDGELGLRALPSPAPGTMPWPRSWAAEVDGRSVGTVTVSASYAQVVRQVEVEAPWRGAAIELLDQMLHGDLQSRPGS